MVTRVRAKARTAAARKPAPAERPVPVVLDSSCWLEHFAGSDRAPLFAEVIDAAEQLVVPVITVYEVVKKLAREVGDEVAAMALTLMQQGRIVDIDMNLALAATRNGLPLADSLIYTTAIACRAELWTQGAHFAGLPGVRLFAKP